MLNVTDPATQITLGIVLATVLMALILRSLIFGAKPKPAKLLCAERDALLAQVHVSIPREGAAAASPGQRAGGIRGHSGRFGLDYDGVGRRSSVE